MTRTFHHTFADGSTVCYRAALTPDGLAVTVSGFHPDNGPEYLRWRAEVILPAIQAMFDEHFKTPTEKP